MNIKSFINIFLFYAALAIVSDISLFPSALAEEKKQEKIENGEESKPIKTHVIRVPGAILVKVGETLFQSKIGVEVVSPIRAPAFHAVNNYAPIISHKINLAFSKLTEDQIKSPATKPELQKIATGIVAQLFKDTRQTLEVKQVIFTEYLVR